MMGGLQHQIGQNFEGTSLYMSFDGAKILLQDRDNIQISLSYTFLFRNDDRRPAGPVRTPRVRSLNAGNRIFMSDISGRSSARGVA